MQSIRFFPTNTPYTVKNYLRKDPRYPIHYPRRIDKYYASLPLNKRTLGKIFGQLHYLSSHAPKQKQKQWKRATDRFIAHHMPVDRCGARWHNKYTAGGWL